MLPRSEKAACCQDASALPAAAVDALLVPASPLSLARRRFGDGPPAAAAAAHVYEMLLGHPAASVRFATAAAVLADLGHWAAQAATDATHPEPQEAAVHRSAEDATEGPSPSETSSSDPRDEDEPAQHESGSAARGSVTAAAGSRKQGSSASGQPAQQLSPAQVSHPSPSAILAAANLGMCAVQLHEHCVDCFLRSKR